MKRRARPTGKGRGTHAPEIVQERRPRGPVQRVVSKKRYGKMIKEREITDGCARSTAMVAALIIALLLLPKCGKTQTHFAFNTSTVIMVDTTGEMTVGSASWPVRAYCDTLEIGRYFLYTGIKWTVMDAGNMICIAPGLLAEYLPGPGGKSLMIAPRGAIRRMEFHEKTHRE